MKAGIVIVFLSAATGYALFSRILESDQIVFSMRGAQAASRSVTARQDDAVSAYEEIMLDQDERYERKIRQANRLSELLGLAEKMNAETGALGSWVNELSKKLAKLYPRESLDYFIKCPTSAEMNQRMFQSIVWHWLEADARACLLYLEMNSNLNDEEFLSYWGEAVEAKMLDADEISLAFSRFSLSRQRFLIRSSKLPEEMLPEMLAMVDDPSFVALMQARFVRESEARGRASVSQNESEPTGLEAESRGVYSIGRLLCEEQASVEKIVKSILGLEYRENRVELLQEVLEPWKGDRGTPVETPAAWIERIAALLTMVNEWPTEPPDMPQFHHEPYVAALAEWLPQQTPKVQRLFAEKVVRLQEAEVALKWTEQLTTESLRLDMRDLVWERWTQTHAKIAAAAMMNDATESERETHLPEAVYRWALYDYLAAKQWIESQSDSQARAAALRKIRLVP